MSRCVFHVGDVFHHMAAIPDHSIDLIVTSPPFLALRSYLPKDHPDKHLEIGSEPTPAAFLTTLLALTREWRRILAPHGSICVELGDTYSSQGGTTDNREDSLGGNDLTPRGARGGGPGWPLPKSLCGIPTLYAWSLAYGHNLLNPDDTIAPWKIRNLIVWHHPNPPVGALGDKVRPSTSYITVACTSDKRWFDLDAERTEHKHGEAVARGSYSHGATGNRRQGGDDIYGDTVRDINLNPAGAPPLDCWIDGDDWTAPPTQPPQSNPNTHRRTAKGVTSRPNDVKTSPDGNRASLPILGESAPAPPLDAWFGDDCGTYGDVWTIPTAPYKGAHYATYPAALPRRLINLMCPRQVCVVCGEPRRRIVEPTEEYAAAIDTMMAACRDETSGSYASNPGKLTRGSKAILSGGVPRLPYDKRTVGWTDCQHPIRSFEQYRRGRVLDPFAGSGTTGVVASESGRDSILIDIDERNLELARQRIGLFLEEGS